MMILNRFRLLRAKAAKQDGFIGIEPENRIVAADHAGIDEDLTDPASVAGPEPVHDGFLGFMAIALMKMLSQRGNQLLAPFEFSGNGR